ncbi:HNH endonuclease signature motif containing protein [Nocardioides sp.]|uniref:HNH endonuclease signature motif containing protein n=1 Tax=Nocardioides sp. TaxID=35761 RepID=UPI002EDAD02C
MAALPLTHPDLDGPGGLLAALETTQAELDRQEIAKFRLAADWAAAHPVDDLDDAATVEGTEGELAIAGPGAPLVAEFCVADFALAIGVSTDAGRSYLGDAVEVRYRLPRLWARVMAGQVAVWRARKIARSTMSLPAEGADHVDRHLAPVAHRLTWAQLERTVEAARATFDPIEAEHRRLLAAEGRFFDVDTHTPSLEGTATVRGELDLADALDLDHAISAGAQQLADLGCAETLDVRRAMAAGALARGDLMLPVEARAEPVKPARTPRQLVVYTHLSEEALAGVENTRSHVLVGQVEGWCASATGPVSVRPVLDLGEHLEVPGYTPSPRLREQVMLTHPTCVFPGCTRPSRGCDLDHVIPWDRGGPTCSCNLVPACRFHHRLKTHGGWRLERVGHRLFTWTSPMGRTYTRHT